MSSDTRDSTDRLFAAWLWEVDREVEALIGLSVHDLPDQPFRDWYDDEMEAAEAAELAIEGA